MKKTYKYLPGNLILKEEESLGALVLGDCNSAIDLSILKPNKIKTIISIGLQALPSKQKLAQDIQHHFYDIHDNKQQKLSIQLLDEVVARIGQGRKRGGILVHCYAGVSRSSSFVIAYLVSTYGLSYDEAKEKTKRGRPCIHPGDGFVRQLQYYAKVIAKREQQRKALFKKEIKIEAKQELQMKESNVEPSPSQRVRRGVRGAVRSAQMSSPQKIKSTLGQNSIGNEKIQQKRQEQQSTRSIDMKDKSKQQKLPPISIKQSRYEKSSSQIQIKKNIQKIQGRSNNRLNLSSLRGVYGNKTKIL